MRIALKLLILEDRQSDVDIVVRELRQAGFEPVYEVVDDEEQFTRRLDPGLDLILADYTLPQFDALCALRIVKARSLDVPFIVVTGSTSEEAAVNCMKEGATDYLLKDRLARLGSAVAQALEGRKLLEEKRKADNEIRWHNAELALLNRIIAASAEATDEKAFLQAACRAAGEALSASLTAVALFDRNLPRMSFVAEHRDPSVPSVLDVSLDLGHGGMGDRLVRAEEPVVIDDFAAHPLALLHAELLTKGRIASAAVVLVNDGSRNTGAIAIASRQPGHFTREKIDLLSSVARQLSGALVRITLGRERLLLSAAMEQTPDAVLITDASGVVQYVNAAFERLTARGREEAAGRPASSLWAPGRELESRGPMLQAMSEGKAWHGRLVCERTKGTPCVLDVSVTPVRAERGDVVSYVDVERNITNEVQLEQRYLQAQKLEAVGRLAGGVAHDFNNLLTAISGYTDILLEQFAPASSEAAALTEIEAAARRAADLTRQLLAFSRKQILQPQVLDLGRTVAEVAKMLRHIIGDDIDLRTKPAADAGRVYADRGQVEQVIMNLAVNSRDAMPNGGTLTIETANAELDEEYASTHPRSRSGSFVALVVSDSGSGMSEEVMAHVFEPFFTTKGEGRGTGLGLATVYGIVEQSGGHISLASELGKGTTVSVFLPRIDLEASAPVAAVSGRPLPRGRETVLLVEDDGAVRRLARLVLEQLGYTVLEAADPESAIRRTGEGPGEIALLITDIMMPRMGGRELADRIVALSPGIRVLYVSGYFEDAFFHAETLPSDIAFLPKPFTPTLLATKVREVLDAPGQA